MNKTDRLIYETRFRYDGLNEEDGDFYLNVIRNTKEVMDSIHNACNGPCNYDIVVMSLHKIDNTVRFSGAISNECENKWLNGVIYDGDKIIVESEITLLHDSVSKVPFHSVDVFSDDERVTTYRDGSVYKSKECDLSKSSAYNYVEGLVMKLK